METTRVSRTLRPLRSRLSALHSLLDSAPSLVLRASSVLQTPRADAPAAGKAVSVKYGSRRRVPGGDAHQAALASMPGDIRRVAEALVDDVDAIAAKHAAPRATHTGPRSLADVCAVQLGAITASIETTPVMGDLVAAELGNDADIVAWFDAVPEPLRPAVLVSHAASICAHRIVLPAMCDPLIDVFVRHGLREEARVVLERRVQLMHPLLGHPPYADHQRLWRVCQTAGLLETYLNALQKYLGLKKVLRTSLLGFIRGDGIRDGRPGMGAEARALLAVQTLSVLTGTNWDDEGDRSDRLLDARRPAWTRATVRALITILAHGYPSSNVLALSTECQRLVLVVLEKSIDRRYANDGVLADLFISLGLCLAMTLSTPLGRSRAMSLTTQLWISRNKCPVRLCLPLREMLRPVAKAIGLGNAHASASEEFAAALLLCSAVRARLRDEQCADAEVRAELSDEDYYSDAPRPSNRDTASQPRIVESLEAMLRREDDEWMWGDPAWWHGIGVVEAREWERLAFEWQRRGRERQSGAMPVWRFESGLDEWVQQTPARKAVDDREQPSRSLSYAEPIARSSRFSTPGFTQASPSSVGSDSSSDGENYWSPGEEGGVQERVGRSWKRAPVALRTPIPVLKLAGVVIAPSRMKRSAAGLTNQADNSRSHKRRSKRPRDTMLDGIENEEAAIWRVEKARRSDSKTRRSESKTRRSDGKALPRTVEMDNATDW